MAEIDWSKSMQRTYEYYKVDPKTWMNTELIQTIVSSTIHRDLNSDMIEYMDITADEIYGEFYVRVYMIVIQNGYTFRLPPLGTFLVQSPTYESDGKRRSISATAYSPLIELSENMPGAGYTSYGEINIPINVRNIIHENTRLKTVLSDTVIDSDDIDTAYVSNPEESWLTYVIDLLSYVDYRLELDGDGSVLFAPKQSISDMQPRYTYTDSDISSILYPDITIEEDIYKIPNVLEVIVSGPSGTTSYFARNEDPNSPLSISSRGREILQRISAPSGLDNTTNSIVLEDYARNYLKSLSTVSCKITYNHGYCPVRIGDCIEMNYERAGIVGVKALVTEQTISCTPDAKVSETATFQKELWGGGYS